MGTPFAFDSRRAQFARYARSYFCSRNGWDAERFTLAEKTIEHQSRSARRRLNFSGKPLEDMAVASSRKAYRIDRRTGFAVQLRIG